MAARGEGWDAVVKTFHWGTASAFFLNALVTESGSDAHVWIGYLAAFLLVVRILWGFAGPRPARFSDFYPSPKRIRQHWQALRRQTHSSDVGHNPMGGAMILLMLALLVSLMVSGLLMEHTDRFWGDEDMEALHSLLVNLMWVCIVLHLLAISIYQWVLRIPLIQRMTFRFRFRFRFRRAAYLLRGLYVWAGGRRHPKEALNDRWQILSTREKQAVMDRVNHYCKLSEPFEPGSAALSIFEFRKLFLSAKSAYFFELYQHLSNFNKSLRFRYRFGDKTHVEKLPTIVKARPVAGDNSNSVLINLDKVRHFNFVEDTIPYDEKKAMLVWRGKVKIGIRRRLVMDYSSHPHCDVGSSNNFDGSGKYQRPFMSIEEQLRFKFILSIEGNDVATNLKWILSSNSLCFMPKPSCETWFMESRLIPGRHYVEVKSDLSDLGDLIDYYQQRPHCAKRIIEQAHCFVEQFRDESLEALIAYKVLEKYFRRSRQIVSMAPEGGTELAVQQAEPAATPEAQAHWKL